MIHGILEVFAELLARFVLEFFFFYSGEAVLWAVTLGRRSPRWNYYTDESPTAFMLFTEVSVWVGIAFWLFVAAMIVNR